MAGKSVAKMAGKSVAKMAGCEAIVWRNVAAPTKPTTTKTKTKADVRRRWCIHFLFHE